MNGYNDWVLPSHDALLSMYTELYLAGIGDFHPGNHLDPAYYWSSTGDNNEEAIAISFYEGNTNDRPKYNLLHVRCVRTINPLDP